MGGRPQHLRGSRPSWIPGSLHILNNPRPVVRIPFRVEENLPLVCRLRAAGPLRNKSRVLDLVLDLVQLRICEPNLALYLFQRFGNVVAFRRPGVEVLERINEPFAIVAENCPLFGAEGDVPVMPAFGLAGSLALHSHALDAAGDRNDVVGL